MSSTWASEPLVQAQCNEQLGVGLFHPPLSSLKILLPEEPHQGQIQGKALLTSSRKETFPDHLSTQGSTPATTVCSNPFARIKMLHFMGVYLFLPLSL